MKHFKKLDKFGEKFSFKYNGYDKYSSRVGGLVCLIIYIIFVANFILNFIPFIRKENYNLQFYTINLIDTEKIIFKNTSFIFGIDCEYKNKTEEAFDKYFEIGVQFKSNNSYETITKKNAKALILKWMKDFIMQLII